MPKIWQVRFVLARERLFELMLEIGLINLETMTNIYEQTDYLLDEIKHRRVVK